MPLYLPLYVQDDVPRVGLSPGGRSCTPPFSFMIAGDKNLCGEFAVPRGGPLSDEALAQGAASRQDFVRTVITKLKTANIPSLQRLVDPGKRDNIL